MGVLNYASWIFDWRWLAGSIEMRVAMEGVAKRFKVFDATPDGCSESTMLVFLV